jgi:hypothetical protein
MTAYEGRLAGMGQFYIQDADEAPPVETWDQSNGLAFPASVGAVILTGGVYGRVDVVLDVRDDAPDLADLGAEWEDVVEISVTCEEGPLQVCDLSQGFVPGLPALDSQGPGEYRMRVHAAGRNSPGVDPDDMPVAQDRYLICCWPAPAQPALAIRLTDQRGLNTRFAWIEQASR